MNILAKIKLGENRFVEFKEKLPSSKNIAKTIVAFSNGAGGEIFIGVNDKGEVMGLNEDELLKMPDIISDIVYSSCYPTIIPDIFIENIKDAKIIVVKVYPGNLRPYFIKSIGKNEGTYVRIGSENKKADIEFLHELERKRRNIGYDSEINYEYDLKQMDNNFLGGLFLKRLGKTLSVNGMKNLGLIKSENGRDYPTNALAILAGKLDNTYTDCARFKGNTKENFIDRKEFSGNLFDQIEEIEKFLKNHLNLSSVIEGFLRKDSYEIPIEALREAVLNALIHRDYARKGCNVKIAIYDDIVEITSPGVLPPSIPLYEIFSSKRSEARNKIIAKIFKELGYIEQWGTGMSKIYRLCKENGLKTPEVKENGYFLQVIFHRKEENKKQEKYRIIQNDTGKTPKKHRNEPKYIESERELINNKEMYIIEYLKKKEKITNEIARKITGLKENGVKSLFRRLAAKDYIEKIGKTKGTYYILKKPKNG